MTTRGLSKGAAQDGSSSGRFTPGSLLGVLVAPTGLWLLVFMLLPVLVLLWITFSGDAFELSMQHLTLENYRAFVTTPTYHRLLLRSLGIAAVVGALSVFAAYPVAYTIAFHGGLWRSLLLTLLIVPALSSFLLRVLAWRIILGSSGVLSSLLLWLGLIDEGVPILLYTPEAVVITLVYVWLPFAALPITVALNRVDLNLLEASADLGSPPLRTFWSVTLPLSMPGVIAAFLLVFIPTVGEYVTPALVGGPEGVMIGNIIWDQFARSLNWPMGALMSFAVLLFMLASVSLAALALRRLGATYA